MTPSKTQPDGPNPGRSTIEGAENPRDLAIDRFRGALVILMVIGDFLAGVSFIPSSLKHAPDIGLTIADLVAPAFVFVIALNFGPSFHRRSRHDVAGAYRHFLWRYLGLIGLGAIIAAGRTIVGRPADWGVLQALGVAGLICLALIRLPTLWRAVIGLSILVAYQVVLDYALLDVVLQSVHGGLFGAISWAGLLILSSALADVWQRGAIWFALWSGALVVTALLSALIVPVSKNRVSLSYVLISLAISSLVFLGLKAVDRLRTSPPGLLCWWGENALALYLLHLVILGVFALPFGDWWYVDATWWLVTLQLMAILSVMSSAAMWLSRRRHAL